MAEASQSVGDGPRAGGVAAFDLPKRRARRRRLLALETDSRGVPGAVARAAVEAFTQTGEAVLDPFCEGGEAVAQAAWAGRRALAVTRRPMTAIVMQAILAPPAPRAVVKRLRELQNDMFYGDASGEPEAIRRMFDPRALSQLIHLRDQLDVESGVDFFIAAMTLALLHRGALASRRPAGRRGPKSMPALPRAVFSALLVWQERLLGRGLPRNEWRLWHGQGTMNAALIETLKRENVALILGAAPPLEEAAPSECSDPRAWFLGMDGRGARRKKARRSDVPGCLSFLLDESRDYYEILRPGGVCALWLHDAVLKGHPNRTVAMAERLWRHLSENAVPFSLRGVASPSSSPSARLLILMKTES